MSTRQNIILPTWGIDGRLDDAGYYTLQCFGLELKMLLEDMFELAVKIDPDTVITTPIEVDGLLTKLYIKDKLVARYNTYITSSPVKIELQAFLTIYIRFFSTIFIYLQGIIQNIVAPCRQINYPIFYVRHCQVISDGIYIQLEVDYLPF